MTRTDGDHDVIDELISDHREVAALLDSIPTTTGDDEKRDLADVAISELVRREHLPDGEEVVKHDTEEHKELERTMKELEGVAADDPRFQRLVGELRSQLQHHVDDEEGEQFPKLRASVPHETLVELREKVDTAKKLAPTRPHPGAPNNALFHKLVGPGVGLVDRARDKLTGRGA
jgi:hypothetical protein